MSGQPIYLDHNSTTPVRTEVAAAMQPWLGASFGNPASAHAFGRKARIALEKSRETVARCLGAFPDEVVFTSGATEANNLAIFGLAGDPPGRIITSAIEHPCVIEPVKQLEKRGLEIEWLRVSDDGIVDIPTSFTGGILSLMAVNHETGAIQPTPKDKWIWHCDAAQAAGKLPIDFHGSSATTLSTSGHKFGAPIGIGALLIRRGTHLRPALFGGHQQQGRRPGTEPVSLAVALAIALEAGLSRREANYQHVLALRDRLAQRLQSDAAPVVVNGPADARRQSPYVLNISFPGLRADALLMALDMAGVACSTGSACSSGSLLPSPVLQAMGVPDDVLRSAMRFSFSPAQTLDEIDEAANRIAEAVRRRRAIAPA